MTKPFHLLAALFLFLTIARPCRAMEPSPADAPGFEMPDGFFPILSWDLPHWSDASFRSGDHGLASLRDCGFTTAAFVRPQHLAETEKLGLKGILAAKDFPIPWRKLSDEQIESAVRQLVDSAGNSPAVMGYFLADEPGAADFPALGKAVAAVKKFAPRKLAYVNLFPDYATLGATDLSQLGTATYREYLEEFVRQVKPQFISYDNYRIQFSNDQKDSALAASYYANLLEVRRVAMEHNLPFWNIVSSNRLLPGTPAPSPANLLLQAYATLAAGAKGLTWYTYYSPGYEYAPIEKAGHRTATWSYLQMVNEQVQRIGPILRPLKSTGVYFTAPQPAGSLPGLPGRWVKGATCDLPLMIGEFTGPGDEKYAMVVNLSLRDSAHFKLDPRDAGDIRQVSPADGSLLPLEPGDAAWLAAGQGVLLRFAPHS